MFGVGGDRRGRGNGWNDQRREEGGGERKEGVKVKEDQELRGSGGKGRSGRKEERKRGR